MKQFRNVILDDGAADCAAEQLQAIPNPPHVIEEAVEATQDPPIIEEAVEATPDPPHVNAVPTESSSSASQQNNQAKSGSRRTKKDTKSDKSTKRRTKKAKPRSACTIDGDLDTLNSMDI